MRPVECVKAAAKRNEEAERANPQGAAQRSPSSAYSDMSRHKLLWIEPFS